MASGKATQFAKPSEDDKRESVPSGNRLSIRLVSFNETSRATGSMTHLSLYNRMLLELQRTMEIRNQFEIIEHVNNEMLNVTPKPITAPFETECYKKLTQKYSYANTPCTDDDTASFKSIDSSVMRAKPSRGIGLRVSMEDVINGIGNERVIYDLKGDSTTRHSWSIGDLDSPSSSLSLVKEPVVDKQKLPFIRIVLRKTELVLLYEQHGMTAIKNTEDGNFAELDNKHYDYLTIGRGKVRRRSEAEAQTFEAFFKSREMNTMPVTTIDAACYVSYFEMFDTFKAVNEMHKSDVGENKMLHSSQSKSLEEQFTTIAQLPSFHLASVIIKRLLAGNTFEQRQRRFRNMSKVSRTVDKIAYRYSINKLFIINPTSKDNIRKAVSDMSFCYSNGDILAVSYGIYSYQAAKLPKTGEVCVWSIKNPCDPERFYSYEVPVVSLEFSPYMPALLAIGLYDGSVEVHNIAHYNQAALAVSQRSSSPGISPVLAIKWIKQASAHGQHDIDTFLTLSQDGSVTQFQIINSPYLAGCEQIVLKRVEGTTEGLPIRYPSDLSVHTNRCPQGLNLTKHPIHSDIYYVLTDEGCIYKCSTNYQRNYLEVLKTHEGAVNCMDFSPWSPKLFLTCGNDWCIRIWMVGIFKPLIILNNLYGPYQWVGWSRVHSTILVAINRKQCEIWDLRRNILKPMSSTPFEQSYNTMGLFSRDGNSIVVGNERGKVFVNALDEMPFPPYYQYDTLEKAIFKAVSNYPDLMIELKNVGYFGYPHKGFVEPP